VSLMMKVLLKPILLVLLHLSLSEAGGCVDKLSNCEEMGLYCAHMYKIESVLYSCPRTCSVCQDGEAAPAPADDCADKWSSSKCSGYAPHCDVDPIKRYNCQKMCGDCPEPVATEAPVEPVATEPVATEPVATAAPVATEPVATAAPVVPVATVAPGQLGKDCGDVPCDLLYAQCRNKKGGGTICLCKGGTHQVDDEKDECQWIAPWRLKAEKAKLAKLKKQ